MDLVINLSTAYHHETFVSVDEWLKHHHSDIAKVSSGSSLNLKGAKIYEGFFNRAQIITEGPDPNSYKSKPRDNED